jgi:hypothetical protein
MKPKPAKEEVVFTMRLPVYLHEKLILRAKEEKRTRHAQIIFMLEKFLSEQLKEKK